MFRLKVACVVNFPVYNIVLSTFLLFKFFYVFANTLKPKYIRTLPTLYNQPLHTTTINKYNTLNALYLLYTFTTTPYILHYTYIFISFFPWLHRCETKSNDSPCVVISYRLSLRHVCLASYNSFFQKKIAIIVPSIHPLNITSSLIFSIKKSQYHFCLFTFCLRRLVIDMLGSLCTEYLMTPQHGSPIKKQFNSG